MGFTIRLVLNLEEFWKQYGTLLIQGWGVIWWVPLGTRIMSVCKILVHCMGIDVKTQRAATIEQA